MSHAMVIGGTGMLAEASIDLAKEYMHVTVTGRRSARVAALTKQCDAINPIAGDYGDIETFLEKINAAIEKCGALDLCVAWVHEEDHALATTIARMMNESGNHSRFFHVLGSANAKPGNMLAEETKAFASLEHVGYRQVILGFIANGTTSRWLTNQEISQGVMRAINEDLLFSVVGVVEPWAARP